MIKASIVGATGYTGAELVRLLWTHPQVEVVAVTSQSYIGQEYGRVFPHLAPINDQLCSEQDLKKLAQDSDVIFAALPHGLSMPIVKEALDLGKKVVDLGADFRLDNPQVYEEWYKGEHTVPDLLEEAIYGLPELNRDKIKGARVVGNPGCYPTSALLALSPLLKNKLIDPKRIIIDSKSGVSGAGRGLSIGIHYAECNESIKAYNIGKHRHIPEIEQELSKVAGEEVQISFTPHLTPMTRGILSTIYTDLREETSEEALHALFTSFYQNERFVRVLPQGELPQTKWCYGSNYCYIGLAYDSRVNRVVVVSAIDNLVKGASGQAIQNMNIMFGVEENLGIDMPGIYP